MVQKYERAATSKFGMEMTVLCGLVVALVCPPLANCVTTPETTTSTTRASNGRLSATFTPDTGFAQMRIGNTSGTNTDICLRFKTRISAGLLFYFGGPTYLAVYLNHRGGLVLHLNTQGSGEGVSSRETFGKDFNDGNWHQITVRRTGNMATLHDSTDDTIMHVTHGIIQDINEELHTDKLFIGGAPDDIFPAGFVWRTPFRGCLEDVRFASYIFNDPKDQDVLYFDGIFSWLGCLESLTCGFECLGMIDKDCSLGACRCSPSYHVLSEDPLVCGRTTLAPWPCGSAQGCTDNNGDNKDNRDNFFTDENELPIIWVLVISVCIFVALLCLCYCVNKKQRPERTPTTTAIPMTQSSEVAFDLNPPTYQEVVTVTDVNPALTELSVTEPPMYDNIEIRSHPPTANQQTELSNHDRGVRPSALPSSTDGLPSQYEGNQVPFEGQRSPDMPPPAYDSFMEYSKTPPGSLEALDV
ncbi:LAMA2 [Branchiostoma lanceolatum]|uniref:LAMA2 protein n=2 Tax=Branchiostoma lanceolatum TaxID=7740 RepID=A0A8J9VME2_BRALA|nr:LAMA2 [Branchiostoma lanceolatum]